MPSAAAFRKCTSALWLSAMPTACHGLLSIVTPGWRNATRASHGPLPSAIHTVSKAWLSSGAPEHHDLMPSRRQPPSGCGEAITRIAGASAAHMPQVLPSGTSAACPSSAMIDSASVWPSNSLTRLRSRAATSASARQRSSVRPHPGRGSRSAPESTSCRKAAATSSAGVAVIRRPRQLPPRARPPDRQCATAGLRTRRRPGSRGGRW